MIQILETIKMIDIFKMGETFELLAAFYLIKIRGSITVTEIMKIIIVRKQRYVTNKF